MPPVYPIIISDTIELDIVYEGIHQVYSSLLFSCEIITRNILRLESELEQIKLSLETDIDDENDERMLVVIQQITEYRVLLYRKKFIKGEMERKCQQIHNLLVRMSDPRPTIQQIAEYQERKRIDELSATLAIATVPTTNLVLVGSTNSQKEIE